MKKVILLALIGMIFTSCSSQTPTVKYIEPVKTIPIELGQRIFNCDSASNVKDIQLSLLKDSLRLLHIYNDSIFEQFVLNKLRVKKVEKYIKICAKNPSQNVFFKGWIIRAIE